MSQSEPSLIYYPDPRLRKPSQPVDRFDDDLRRLAGQMVEIMRRHRGVGLAAPQVGANIRLFVMSPSADDTDCSVLVNPVIETSEGAEEAEEGCLSIPEVYVKVTRAASLTLSGQDPTGQPLKLTLQGFAARVAQHEYDHLDGTLIIDRMLPSAKIATRKRLRELEEQYQGR